MPLAELEAGHKFELRDITVRFPEGLLSVVTGPLHLGKGLFYVVVFLHFPTCWEVRI